MLDFSEIPSALRMGTQKLHFYIPQLGLSDPDLDVGYLYENVF